MKFNETQRAVMIDCISIFMEYGNEVEMKTALEGCKKYTPIKITKEEVQAIVKREKTLYERCQILDHIYKELVDLATGEQLFEVQKMLVGEKAYKILDMK